MAFIGDNSARHGQKMANKMCWDVTWCAVLQGKINIYGPQRHAIGQK